MPIFGTPPLAQVFTYTTSASLTLNSGSALFRVTHSLTSNALNTMTINFPAALDQQQHTIINNTTTSITALTVVLPNLGVLSSAPITGLSVANPATGAGGLTLQYNAANNTWYRVQ